MKSADGQRSSKARQETQFNSKSKSARATRLRRGAASVNCIITSEYFNLKLKELQVWAEELARREEEKERKKAYQQKLREQSKLNGEDIDIEEVEDELEFTKNELAAVSPPTEG